MRIITDFEEVSKRIGIDILRGGIHKPQFSLDAKKDSTPVLVENGNKNYLICEDMERSTLDFYLDTKDIDVELLYFNPYFTWEKTNKVFPNFISALSEVLKGKIVVSDDITIGRFEEIKGNFEISVEQKDRIQPYQFYCYKTTPSKVLKKLKSSKSLKDKKIEKLIDTLYDRKIKSELLPYIGRAVNPFKLLNSLMKEKKADTIVASSALNIQKLTGVETDKISEEALAIYTGREIYLLSPFKIMGDCFKMEEIFKTPREVLKEFGGQNIGVEEKSLSLYQYESLGLENYKKCTILLRKWKARTAINDLIYYIIAVKAAEYAIRKALDYARKNVSKRITEIEVGRKYSEYLRVFNSKYELLGVEIEKYFLVTIMGSRGYYPSVPSRSILNKDMNTLKIDAGAIVKDGGIVRGSSDICRTYTLTEAGRKAYGLFEEVMLMHAIPAAKPDIEGREVYEKGVMVLGKNSKLFKDAQMMPRDSNIDGYDRDIGHAVGIQPLHHLSFTKNEKWKLEEGMICCVEYQWPYNKHNIGIEDQFLVGKKGGINLTR